MLTMVNINESMLLLEGTTESSFSNTMTNKINSIFQYINTMF
jgi:hypothetical protein